MGLGPVPARAVRRIATTGACARRSRCRCVAWPPAGATWGARAHVDDGVDALLGRQQAIGRDGIQRAATEAVEEFLHRQGLRRRHRGPPLPLPFVFETLMNADSNSERTSSDLMSPSWRAE